LALGLRWMGRWRAAKLERGTIASEAAEATEAPPA
jgi:hypothetical protein